jgi:hypothetical protein
MRQAPQLQWQPCRLLSIDAGGTPAFIASLFVRQARFADFAQDVEKELVRFLNPGG